MHTDPRVPDWLLEQLLTGDLDTTTEADVRARLAREAGGTARLQALEEDNKAIFLAHPPEVVTMEIELRAKQAEGDAALSRKRTPWLTWVPILTMAAAVAVVVLPQGSDLSTVEPALSTTDVTTVKGLEPQLGIHRKTGRKVEQLEAGSDVQAGDVLQVSYNAAGEPFGVIFSIDGSGVLTMHHPRETGRSPTLTTTGRVFLPRSYALDSAPNFERFFLVTSETPFDVEGVVAAAKQLASDKATAAKELLPLPTGLNQISVTLNKAEPEAP